jgi:hypothetical protein
MELDLYGRLVVLTGCDAFTRSHLASEGIELAAQEPPPTDPYEVISFTFLLISFLLRVVVYVCPALPKFSLRKILPFVQKMLKKFDMTIVRPTFELLLVKNNPSGKMPAQRKRYRKN